MASKKGFAAMDPEKRAAISRKGGKAAHAKGVAHEFTHDEAVRAGRLGGLAFAAKLEDKDEPSEVNSEPRDD